MIPEYVRVGDRYGVPSHLIKYFYMDTEKNELTCKLKDGEELSFSYGEDKDKARRKCLRNYIYLLETFSIPLPHWITKEDMKIYREDVPEHAEYTVTVVDGNPSLRYDTGRAPDWITSIDGPY